MDLYNIETVKKILSRHGFSFSKSLGQNFIIDPSVCPAMAQALDSDGKTGVLEIGPGIGVLTKELCKTAEKVTAVELDKRLIAVLGETLKDFNNVEIINGDIMKLDIEKLVDASFCDCDQIKVCANLPYYITTPIITALLEGKIFFDEMVLMVQKEAGERLCAEVGTRKSGAVTAAVNYYADSEILFSVPKESFMPSPKVDSVVIKLIPRKEKKYTVSDEEKFFSVIKAAFAQRRKTALNSISNSTCIPKSTLAQIFSEFNLDINIRAEKLTMQNFVDISQKI